NSLRGPVVDQIELLDSRPAAGVKPGRRFACARREEGRQERLPERLSRDLCLVYHLRACRERQRLAGSGATRPQIGSNAYEDEEYGEEEVQQLGSAHLILLNWANRLH